MSQIHTKFPTFMMTKAVNSSTKTFANVIWSLDSSLRDKIYTKHSIQSYFQSLYRIKLIILNLDDLIIFCLLEKYPTSQLEVSMKNT